MSDQPEALRLAECLDEPLYTTHKQMTEAAAELRRLARVEAQRDALLEKITAVIAAEQSQGAARGGFIHTPPTKEHHRRVVQAWKELHAAIRAVEGENHAKNL